LFFGFGQGVACKARGRTATEQVVPEAARVLPAAKNHGYGQITGVAAVFVMSVECIDGVG